MHFYCPTCHTPVYDYLSDTAKSRRLVERIGSQILTLLLLAFIIGASVMVARAINWKELVGGIQSAGGSADPAPAEKPKRKTRQTAPARKRNEITRKSVNAVEASQALKQAEKRTQ
jgi:hypothetical protein